MNLNLPLGIAIHPIVLLSIVDHYERSVGNKKNKRVMGVLLGEKDSKGNIDCTNCYAIPFDEDPKQEGVWFVDHMYHEYMYSMFRKINAKEKILGWYASGTEIKIHDIEINELFKRYCPMPVYLLIDVENNDNLALPTEAYVSINEVDSQGIIVKNFKHIPTSIEAYEAEEVGVEHLLRDIKDINMDSLTNSVGKQITGLKGLMSKLNQIMGYLKKCEEGHVQPDKQIIFSLQELLNILPKLDDENQLKAFQAKTNDNYFTIYVSSIVRSVIALHDLINNKLVAKKFELDRIKEKNKDKEEKAKKEVAQAAGAGDKTDNQKEVAKDTDKKDTK